MESDNMCWVLLWLALTSHMYQCIIFFYWCILLYCYVKLEVDRDLSSFTFWLLWMILLEIWVSMHIFSICLGIWE
jgi:hypothetical protein